MGSLGSLYRLCPSEHLMQWFPLLLTTQWRVQVITFSILQLGTAGYSATQLHSAEKKWGKRKFMCNPCYFSSFVSALWSHIIMLFSSISFYMWTWVLVWSVFISEARCSHMTDCEVTSNRTLFSIEEKNEEAASRDSTSLCKQSSSDSLCAVPHK